MTARIGADARGKPRASTACPRGSRRDPGTVKRRARNLGLGRSLRRTGTEAGRVRVVARKQDFSRFRQDVQAGSRRPSLKAARHAGSHQRTVFRAILGGTLLGTAGHVRRHCHCGVIGRRYHRGSHGRPRQRSQEQPEHREGRKQLLNGHAELHVPRISHPHWSSEDDTAF